MAAAAASSETKRVRCAECGHYSEILAPPADHEGPVVWLCPQQLDSGELCGTRNEHP